MATDFIQVLTTVDDEARAHDLARAAVEARLAACGQVLGPMRSVYWWQGQVETATEWLVLLKSRRDLYPDLEVLLRREHPYDTPEILAVPIEVGLDAYLTWMQRTLRPRSSPRPL